MTVSLFRRARLRPPTSGIPRLQELKSAIHQELLGRLNLERLARVKREDAEPEIEV